MLRLIRTLLVSVLLVLGIGVLWSLSLDHLWNLRYP